jgi:hypothetical protein
LDEKGFLAQGKGNRSFRNEQPVSKLRQNLLADIIKHNIQGYGSQPDTPIYLIWSRVILASEPMMSGPGALGNSLWGSLGPAYGNQHRDEKKSQACPNLPHNPFLLRGYMTLTRLWDFVFLYQVIDHRPTGFQGFGGQLDTAPVTF